VAVWCINETFVYLYLCMYRTELVVCDTGGAVKAAQN
jgi:hypothetical protein